MGGRTGEFLGVERGEMSFGTTKNCPSDLNRFPRRLTVWQDQTFNPVIWLVLIFFFITLCGILFLPFYWNSKDRNKNISMKSVQHKVTFKQAAVSHCVLPGLVYGVGEKTFPEAKAPLLVRDGMELTQPSGRGWGVLFWWPLMGLSTWKCSEPMPMLSVQSCPYLTFAGKTKSVFANPAVHWNHMRKFKRSEV